MVDPAARLSVQPDLTAAQRSNHLGLTAWGYDLWRRRALTLLTGEPFSLAREARLFLTSCRPAAGERWLDAGTSTGFYAGVLAAQRCRVDAADLSAAMLRRAERRCPSRHITWHQVNLEASGWPDAQYDGATVGATLNETRNPRRLLQEVSRQLRPGGQLWLMWVSRHPGVAQTGLQALGGLNFPDVAWVDQALPGLQRRHLVQAGAVAFGQWIKV
ncbi:class I SAM-dependent methyltransferase [Deinococcus navajonensis]|uniref:Class I SAM-dependent methyltransferase n=1 Tax=Deinococcus navajonensis TaxID=309884 RepID=A0ABV8XJT8_9DEIO